MSTDKVSIVSVVEVAVRRTWDGRWGGGGGQRRILATGVEGRNSERENSEILKSQRASKSIFPVTSMSFVLVLVN